MPDPIPSGSTLILDGNQRSALATTRSLGRKGIRVVTADISSTSLSGHSRYSYAYERYANPVSRPSDTVSQILDIVQRHEIDTVFPMTDLSVHLLLSHQSEFAGIKLPCPEFDQYQRASNKARLIEEAQALGIRCPNSVFVQPESIDTCLNDDLKFPLIVKPPFSCLRLADSYIRTKVRVAESMTELATLLRECRPELQAGFLLQEFIPGSGAGYFALFAHGSLLARFSHRRIREKPPSGGVSVVSESSAIDPRIDGPSTELLERLDWHGPAMVEYRISEDGTPYLMEINARFWGSLQLPIYAGIDFPYLAWRIANGELPEAVLDYELGVRNRWLLGDLDHLYLSWKDGAISLRQKLRTTAGFLNVFDSRVRSEVSQPGDRAPFYYELRNYFRRS